MFCTQRSLIWNSYLVERNLELFKRGLESCKNHQFGLLNDNFRTFAHKVEASSRELTKQVTDVKAAVSSLINFNNNNSVSVIKRHNEGIKRESSWEEICLDSPPSVTSKTPFIPNIQPKSEFSMSSFHTQPLSGPHNFEAL